MDMENMRLCRQWVCWRLEPDPKGEKPRKVPYNPKNGSRASATNPETWGTMEEALAAKERYLFAGIGFVFTEGCGIVGVDIDHCLDENGQMNETARAITGKYPTYTEISPSGKGLHLFYRGSGMPGKGNKNSESGVEMYAAARYFTMTGKRPEGSPEEIRDGAEALPWIHETYIARKKKGKKAARSGRDPSLKKTYKMPDGELMEKARSAKNGEEFRALYSGQWTGRFGSQSEADMRLCGMLAFWSGKDPEQMDRLFRRSGLIRPKWDEVHSSDGQTYGQKTIAAAIEHTEETFSPGGTAGIFVSGGQYMREKGENVYPLTNFLVEPAELLEFEDEAQMTCNMVTVNGIRIRLVLMTGDMSSVVKFRSVLSKKTLCLSFLGGENDLEILKAYLSGLAWPMKRGVRACGLYERDGRWLYADTAGAFAAGGEAVDDLVQMEKAAVIESRVTRTEPATAGEIRGMGSALMNYNEPIKTVTVLAWVCGCYVKEILRGAGVKYPHLYLIGEAGSGKSTTLERIIQPLFGTSRTVAAPQTTAFTLMKESASSNLYPQILDEYKPSRIDRVRVGMLSNHFRNSYDGHEGIRGRADQTQVSYDLLAPLVAAGEEAPQEPSVRERGMELLFSKRDLKNPVSLEAFRQIVRERETMTKIGRLLLDTALTLDTETVAGWHREGLGRFTPHYPTRVISNLACCHTGLRVMEAALKSLGTAWEEVFPIGMEQCDKWLDSAAFEYLLNGRNSTTTVVEHSLEIMDRMGLTDEECKFLGNGLVAVYFRGFYDRFTRYIRENAITAEHLAYEEFMRQLKKSEMFLDIRTVRMGGGDPKRAAVLDYTTIQQRCDVEGFIRSRVEPL